MGGKRPPGPKALPIIGNLHILGTLSHRTLQALATRYGPIISLKLGQVPTIEVSSPETAELFLKTHDTVFASRPQLQASDGSKGLSFSKYGAYWRNVRKLATLQLLNASKVLMFGPLRNEELGLLVKSLEKASTSREFVDVSELVGELIENVTYKMVLGHNKDDRFNLKGLIHENMNLLGAFNIADFVPWLAAFDLQGLTQRSNKASNALDQLLEQIIKDHEQPSSNEQKGPHKKDFVDILLSLMNQPMDPQGEHTYVIDRSNIKAIIIDLITGAIDTSATTIEWAMSGLLKQPRVMKRLQDELEHVVGLNREVDESDLEKLPYLNMVVKETFRLYPPGPLLVPHESLEDVTIDGYYIKKKSRIIINAWARGRDPKVWSDKADIFYLERFEDNNIDIWGIQLGLITVKIVLAQLVHCFSIISSQ